MHCGEFTDGNAHPRDDSQAIGSVCVDTVYRKECGTCDVLDEGGILKSEATVFHKNCLVLGLSIQNRLLVGSKPQATYEL